MIMPDYNDSITNLACSIMKYFELNYKHNTIEDIDNILEEKQPKNVVVILYDGMGYNLLKKHLSNEEFLVKNLIREFSSVVPSTTTAATTSMLSGLNPCEHGWLGWDLYIKPIDKIVTMFLNTLKDSTVKAADYNVAHHFYPYKTITDQINEEGKYTSKILFPFGRNRYYDLNDMLDRIIYECKKDGKKYIYAYYEDPDDIMHSYGTDSEKAINCFKNLNNKMEDFCSKLGDDTVAIVTADHGHINSKGVLISDYPDFLNTLDGDVWIEGRMCSFKVKTKLKEQFCELFQKYFSADFVLKTKEEVLNEQLFGIGEEHELFRDSLGDYFALGIRDKYFRYSSKSVNLVSMHAGFTEDEMKIPMIVYYK